MRHVSLSAPPRLNPVSEKNGQSDRRGRFDQNVATYRQIALSVNVTSVELAVILTNRHVRSSSSEYKIF